MSFDETKALVRRYYNEVFVGRDLAALDTIFAPTFIGHSFPHGEFSLVEMRRDISFDHSTMPEFELHIEDQIAEDDRVMTRWRYRWKHDQSVFGEIPSGSWVEMDGIHIHRIERGRIAEVWEIKDFAGVMQQLGVDLTKPLMASG